MMTLVPSICASSTMNQHDPGNGTLHLHAAIAAVPSLMKCQKVGCETNLVIHPLKLFNDSLTQRRDVV